MNRHWILIPLIPFFFFLSLFMVYFIYYTYPDYVDDYIQFYDRYYSDKNQTTRQLHRYLEILTIRDEKLMRLYLHSSVESNLKLLERELYKCLDKNNYYCTYWHKFYLPRKLKPIKKIRADIVERISKQIQAPAYLNLD